MGLRSGKSQPQLPSCHLFSPGLRSSLPFLPLQQKVWGRIHPQFCFWSILHKRLQQQTTSKITFEINIPILTPGSHFSSIPRVGFARSDAGEPPAATLAAPFMDISGVPSPRAAGESLEVAKLRNKKQNTPVSPTSSSRKGGSAEFSSQMFTLYKYGLNYSISFKAPRPVCPEDPLNPSPSASSHIPSGKPKP